MAAADIEGDRDIDLVAARGGCPDFALLQNDGPLTIAARSLVNANLGARLFAAADFNADGATDLASSISRGPFSGGLALLLRQASSPYRDCNADGVPDECELDCNENASPDGCDIASGISSDCDRDGVPDECEADCNANSIADACELEENNSLECNTNGIPDSCELSLSDCDANGVLDACDLRLEPERDRDSNGILDSCELAPRFALSQEEYIVGGEPAAVAAADLDGDGALDIALGVDFLDSCLSPTLDCSVMMAVAFNAGGGVFGEPAFYPSPVFPSEVAASDLDADGDADLVAAGSGVECPAGGYSVFLNDGGEFKQGGRFSAARGEVRSLRLADLSGDGYPELVGLVPYGLEVLMNRTEPPRSLDLDRDGAIDSCREQEFRRGDLNRDGADDLSDAVILITRLFLGSGALECEKAADADDDGRLNLTDALRLLTYLVGEGAPLAVPFAACGGDPTPDALACPRFPPCRG